MSALPRWSTELLDGSGQTATRTDLDESPGAQRFGGPDPVGENVPAGARARPSIAATRTRDRPSCPVRLDTNPIRGGEAETPATSWVKSSSIGSMSEE